MPFTGFDVVEEARASYLNFKGGVTDESLLNILNSEYRKLQRKLRVNDVPAMRKLFDPLTLGLGVTRLDAAALPSDLIYPINVYEKSQTAAVTDYVKMTEQDPLVRRTADPTLQHWQWIGEALEFVGATTIRMVQIYGVKSLPKLTKLLDNVLIADADGFLAAAVASTAARTIGHNPTLADSIWLNYAQPALNDLMAAYTQKNQSLPFRHRTWRRGG